MSFTESFHCKSRAHCLACRNDAGFRASVVKAGMEETQDFECPIDLPIVRPDDPPSARPGLGDLIEKLAKPVAKALKLDCLDSQDRLKPESPCAKRRDALNKIHL